MRANQWKSVAALDLQPFFLAEHAAAQTIAQAAGNNQGRIFSGLWQEHHEFISAVSEGKVNQAELGLDQISDFRQQFAANQVAVGVVYLLEMVEVDEQHREFVSESRRAINLRLQCLIEMARIVEPGAIISDGQFLDFFDRTRVFNRNRRIVAQRLQEERLLIAEVFHVYVYELNYAQHPQFRSQRNANDGLGLPLRHFVNPFRKALVGSDVRNDQLFAILRDVACNSFADSQPDILQSLGCRSHGNGEVQFLLIVIHHEQRPSVGTEVFRHLFHDGLQNGIQVERRGQGLRHIVEDAEFLRLTGSLR